MIHRLEAARRLVWLWLPPLVFVALGLGAVVLYTAFFAGRVASLERAFERASTNLGELRQDRDRLAGLLGRIEGQKEDIDLLYREYFGTEEDRFTRSVREIRDLARRAGLDPSSFGYAAEKLNEEDLEGRSIRFAVEGDYDELRTFINYLELTDQFFVLEEVGLGGADQQRRNQLSIQLSLSTVFAQPGSVPQAADEQPGAGDAAAVPAEAADAEDAGEEGAPELVEVGAEEVAAE